MLKRSLLVVFSLCILASPIQGWAPRPLATRRSTSWSPEFRHSGWGDAVVTTPSTPIRSVATTEPLYDANMKIPENAQLIGRILNGMVLASCFGYALYTILNIDHGMTRGWTAAEIARRVPLDNWSSYESALSEKPILTKTTINVIIYLLGDWLSQTAFQKKNILDFDLGRTLRNGFIGLCFGPLVHEYYEFSDQILPVEGGLMNRGAKILMDQTLYLTVKCSIYIAAVSLLGGESWQTAQHTVKDRIAPVVLTAWKFWPLVHCITYGLIPARHRILWVNCVDLVWNAILASQAREPEEPEHGESADVVFPHEEETTLALPVVSVLEEENEQDALEPVGYEHLVQETDVELIHKLDLFGSSMDVFQDSTNSTHRGELVAAM